MDPGSAKNGTLLQLPFWAVSLKKKHNYYKERLPNDTRCCHRDGHCCQSLDGVAGSRRRADKTHLCSAGIPCNTSNVGLLFMEFQIRNRIKREVK